VRTADGLDAGLGEAEVANLPLCDELLHGVRDILDRDVGVHAVLVEQVDVTGAEPPQRLLHASTDRVGSAVEAPGLAGGKLEAELRGDDDPVADRFERFADEVLRW
jgi:hypothetical protein